MASEGGEFSFSLSDISIYFGVPVNIKVVGCGIPLCIL